MLHFVLSYIGHFIIIISCCQFIIITCYIYTIVTNHQCSFADLYKLACDPPNCWRTEVACLSRMYVIRRGYHHRVDSCYREFIRTKNYALNNLWWHFTQVIMKARKSFLKIWLLSVNFEKFTSINVWSGQSQSGVWRAVIGCSIAL